MTVEVTYAAPHHLVADGPVLAVRRTRSGDAWEARSAGRAAGPASGSACPRSAYPRRCPTRPPAADPWLTEQLDLDAYLARPRRRAREPSVEALAELQEAHVRAFTFDNIDVLLEDHAGVGLPAVQAKFVGRGRGGYCFEHTTLFAAAAQRLGYDAVASSAASATRSWRRARTPSRS